MMEFSSAFTYGFYGVMSVLPLLFVWKMVPETKGSSLEEMEVLRRGKQDMLMEEGAVLTERTQV